jgi:O-antigen biosynthesis protein
LRLILIGIKSKMKNWLYYANEDTVKRLNKSYDKRTSKYLIWWLLQPSVFTDLTYRCFLLFLKIFIKAEKSATPTPEQQEAPIYVTTQESLSRHASKSLIDFLLFRKIEYFSEPDLAQYSPLYQVETFQKSDFDFKASVAPAVSVIIPVYNQLAHTLTCLQSISKNNTADVEIIVIDDCSTDHTAQILSQIDNICLVKNTTNQGFLQNCNDAALIAKGTYICFLNNDTQVQPGWLETMLEVFNDYEDAGAVGSMLLYPDGRLQEAGGIIWNDASGMNVGKFQNPYHPQYRFVRPVDYCSGASLLLKKSDFMELGMFDTQFKPAYYEDTDICFAVQTKLNKKVYYQPFSVVIHDEGLSSGTDTSAGVKSYQVVNHQKFLQKWKDKLATHPSGQSNTYQSLSRLCGSKTVLIIDSYVPRHDKESGSNRLFGIIKIMKSLHYHVVFLTDVLQKEWPYAEQLQKLGVDTLYFSDKYQITTEPQLQERIVAIDIAWVCRPETAKKYFPFLKKHHIKVIYDTIDLHFIRLERKLELNKQDKKLRIQAKEIKKMELKLGKMADITLAITEKEEQILIKNQLNNVHTIPNVHPFRKRDSKPFEKREGILFIGSYMHDPNIDAVEWLCNEIMPLVWKVIPEAEVTLLGSNPSPEILNLANDKVKVPGYVQNVEPYFINSRLFVAPLRYGAGMKGKLGQSFEFGLPIVSTSIGVEGMNLEHNKNVLVADSAENFAQEIVRLYTEQSLWTNVALESENAIKQYSPEHVRTKIGSLLQNL